MRELTDDYHFLQVLLGVQSAISGEQIRTVERAQRRTPVVSITT
jgi:hypothetical protein